LTPEPETFIQARLKTGCYQTAGEVVREALRLLDREEKGRASAVRRLKSKLERGAAQAERGELLEPGEVFEELRNLIDAAPGRPLKAVRS
jgi:antitoxin ParD1/3/4